MKQRYTQMAAIEAMQKQDHDNIMDHEARLGSLEDRIEHHKRDNMGALERFRYEINKRLDTLDEQVKDKMGEVLTEITKLKTEVAKLKLEKNKLYGAMSVIKPIGQVILGAVIGHLWK